jgi:hypothetical protein
MMLWLVSVLHIRKAHSSKLFLSQNFGCIFISPSTNHYNISKVRHHSIVMTHCMKSEVVPNVGIKGRISFGMLNLIFIHLKAGVFGL